MAHIRRASIVDSRSDDPEGQLDYADKCRSSTFLRTQTSFQNVNTTLSDAMAQENIKPSVENAKQRRSM